MSKVSVVFPHQLFEHNPLVNDGGKIVLVEEYLFFKQYAFHKQKIVFHRASMKWYEQFLRAKGCEVVYVEANDFNADIRKLIPALAAKGVTSIAYIDPVDDWLSRRMQSAAKANGIALTVHESPMFLNTNADLEHFFKPTKKKYFQTEFYKQERIKRNILLDAKGNPLGGKWSFDEENRKRYPKGKQMISVEFPLTDAFTLEARDYTEKHFAANPGVINKAVVYPIGFEAAQLWLDQFLHERMFAFGDYEDAIVRKEMLLHHSLLTPTLNVGMITPQQIIDRTLAYHATHEIPINSLEGFIRQMIGWREFIRGVYVVKGREQRVRNYWGFTRKIPDSFYTGTTGISPIDETIRKVLQTGYCHHIERLMVLGNFMVLCEFDPDEVYRWFMELFIDSYDWVMVPNVYGMSQFADGGMLSTKPYISGSNYLMKMSDYPKGEWQEIWDALFWRFMDVHRAFFLSNPRLSMLVRTYDKWDEAKKSGVRERAEKFLGSDL